MIYGKVRGMIKLPCGGDIRCDRYTMSLAEFKTLCGEAGNQEFNSTVGKAATKLHRETYGKDPAMGRCKIAKNVVKLYPCGIIEQAYRHWLEQVGG